MTRRMFAVIVLAIISSCSAVLLAQEYDFTYMSSDAIAAQGQALQGNEKLTYLRELRFAAQDPSNRELANRIIKALGRLDREPRGADYPSAIFMGTTCWDLNSPGPECDDSLGGFAYASRRRSEGKQCRETVRDVEGRSSSRFVQGIREWWKSPSGSNDKDACKPSKPSRCLLAFCSGDDTNPYSWGISFRPAIEFGAVAGKGFGFDEETFAAAFEMKSTIGIRLFFANDLFDIHAGGGVGSVVVEDQVKRPGVVACGGIGFWNGFFNISYVGINDTFVDRDSWGHGVSFAVDAAAIANIVGQNGI